MHKVSPVGNSIFLLKSLVIAAGALVLVLTSELEPGYWWLIPFVLVLGFLFGKFTCDAQFRNVGLLTTLGLFAGLNFFHSMIDGVAFMELNSIGRYLGIFGHELIRQPALYVVVFGMLHPFSAGKTKKILLAAIAVTGVWLLGLFAGQYWGGFIEQVGFLRDILEYSLFLFIGDVIHHLYDDWQKLRGKHSH